MHNDFRGMQKQLNGRGSLQCVGPPTNFYIELELDYGDVYDYW